MKPIFTLNLILTWTNRFRLVYTSHIMHTCFFPIVTKERICIPFLKRLRGIASFTGKKIQCNNLNMCIYLSQANRK